MNYSGSVSLNIYELYVEDGREQGDSNMVRKVVIPAAGLGTRLFPATKEQPKEMLPIFATASNGSMLVKPVVQLVFEQVHEAGLREFCFVIGRGKRGIEDHFTPDANCIRTLEGMGKNGQATDLEEFYEKLDSSKIMWVNQPEAKGFGNAVLTAQPFVQNEPCLVHAGDSAIISKDMDYIKKLLNAYKRLNADAAFIALEIENPKQYGIVEGDEVESGIFKVKRVVEKPEKPATNLAIMAMYAFHPIIFKALEATKPGKNGEIQLTDAIQKLVDWGLKVYAVRLDKSYSHLDIGSPERYWEALDLSYNQFCKRHNKMIDKIILEDIETIKSNVKADFFAGKKVLVTGGAGFIGSWLCDVLLSFGSEVTVVDDFSTGRTKNIDHLTQNPKFKLIKSDVCKFEIEEKLDLILHMAGHASPDEYMAHPIETLQTSADGTRNMAEIARKNDATLLFASTSEVYGDAEVVPTPETYWGKVNPIGPRSCYDEGKRFAEALLMAYCKQYGLDVRVPRIFNSYGPRLREDGLYGRAMSRFILQALTNQPITVYGDGKQTRSFCYITDTATGSNAVGFKFEAKGKL